MRFSVIIPTLNEEQSIGACLSRISTIAPGTEVIVADGGSTDDTLTIAEERGAAVCMSPRGRGIQMNAGAGLASGDILVFLHVDTRLPDNAFDTLREAFAGKDMQVGTFRLAFDERHPILDLYSKLTRFDAFFTRAGDQCIVVRKSFFERMGGFPDWPLFEDIHFLRAARGETRIHSFPATVLTSARRFRRNGIVTQSMLNIWYFLLYYAGIPANQLAAKYEARR